MANKIKLYFFATPGFKVYRGYDFNNDPIEVLKDGAAVSVSPKKAEILLADYPLNFSEFKERPERGLETGKREPPENPKKDGDQGGDDAKTEDVKTDSGFSPGEE